MWIAEEIDTRVTGQASDDWGRIDERASLVR